MIRNMISRILVALLATTTLFYLAFQFTQGPLRAQVGDYAFGKHVSDYAFGHHAADDSEIPPMPADPYQQPTNDTSDSDVAILPAEEEETVDKMGHSVDLLPLLPPPVGIVSMLYGSPAHYYVRAIESYERYAQRHNYPTYVLRRQVSEGPLEGIWNKVAYLLYVMVLELQKPEEERTQWLLWVDADSILANPAIPMDIFLPPTDFPDVRILAARDENGFNMGIFFIKVHGWSITFLNKVLAYPQYNSKDDLFWLEQSASIKLFGEDEFKPHVLWQPRMWWNPYRRNDVFEGEVGDVMIHFPNLGGAREERMVEYLKYAESETPSEWEISLSHTKYPREVEQYWATLRYGRETIEWVNYNVKDKDSSSSNFQVAFERLEAVMKGDTDMPRMIRKAADEVHRVYEMYESPEAKENIERIKNSAKAKADKQIQEMKFRYDDKWNAEYGLDATKPRPSSGDSIDFFGDEPPSPSPSPSSSAAAEHIVGHDDKGGVSMTEEGTGALTVPPDSLDIASAFSSKPLSEDGSNANPRSEPDPDANQLSDIVTFSP